jgi:hypothetical protein
MKYGAELQDENRKSGECFFGKKLTFKHNRENNMPKKPEIIQQLIPETKNQVLRLS